MARNPGTYTNSIINTIRECYDEAQSAWMSWMDEFEEDVRFYLSDQWSDEDKERASKNDVPVLVLNFVKKTIDLVSGYERQNRTDIKILPVEGSDERVSQIMTTLIKWIMGDKEIEYNKSDAFKDALIGGIGWLYTTMNFDKDPLNGDIHVEKVSPTEILLDPYTKKQNLSDCDYIIRHNRVSRRKLAAMYPKYKDEISALTGSTQTEPIERELLVPQDRATKLLVVEYWHREWENRKFIVDTENPGEIVEYSGKEEALKLMLNDNAALEVIEKKVPVIKLTISIEHQLVVYDDDAPYTTKKYPFIPVFCFYTSSFVDWKWKLQGLVRPMKDPQREKNKRRSQIMRSLNVSMRGGWLMDKGAVDDKNVLYNSSGVGKVIEKNPGRLLEQMQAPVLDQGIMQLELAFDKDIQQIGVTPDLLGQVYGGSGSSAPGVTIQLRQKQGITTLQECFDNLSMATKNLGELMIYLIAEHFEQDKIKRILGTDLPFDAEREAIQKSLAEMPAPITTMPDGSPMPIEMQHQNAMMSVQTGQQIEAQLAEVDAAEKLFWDAFMDLKQMAKFDVIVEESNQSPTQRFANLSAVLQAAQYNIPVPPEVIIDLIDVPVDIKKNMKGYLEQQQQMQAAKTAPVPKSMPATPPEGMV
jgi:hypothetical protein